MGVIRIEPEDPVKEDRCPGCGGTTRLLHGYVYDDEHPHGIYFLDWCEGPHPDRAAFLTVGLGAFGEDTDPADRRAFCVEWRADGMRLAEGAVRDHPELLGRFVPREAALAMGNIEHLWHVADHVVRDDPRVAALEDWLASA